MVKAIIWVRKTLSARHLFISNRKASMSIRKQKGREWEWQQIFDDPTSWREGSIEKEDNGEGYYVAEKAQNNGISSQCWGWRKSFAEHYLRKVLRRLMNRSRMNRIRSIINVTASRLLMTMSSPLTIPFFRPRHNKLLLLLLFAVQTRLARRTICVGFSFRSAIWFLPTRKKGAKCSIEFTYQSCCSGNQQVR